MDLTQPINHNFLVERKGFAFSSDIEYENLPDFCSHCKKIGHDVQYCKQLKKPIFQLIQKAKVTYLTKSVSTLQGETLRPNIIGDDVVLNSNRNDTREEGQDLDINQ
ncbi:unnamed protein product [Lathyrus sativus]|nr:unnamed protein product [Lathyrus sativus]